MKRAMLICAWILWAHGAHFGATYQAIQGYDSREACVSVMHTMKPTPDHDRFACFPDTLDPRFKAFK